MKIVQTCPHVEQTPDKSLELMEKIANVDDEGGLYTFVELCPECMSDLWIKMNPDAGTVETIQWLKRIWRGRYKSLVFLAVMAQDPVTQLHNLVHSLLHG